MTGVPGITYFGPDENGHGTTYDDIRSSDDDRKIRLLELRLQDLLIKQIRELVVIDGQRKVYSPIPLAIMTCIAIEVIGQIFFLGDNFTTDKDQRSCFKEVLNMFDQRFSRQLNKEFSAQLKVRFPSEKIGTSKSRSDIIYSYFRNTLMHEFKGRAVYIEESIESWEDGEGFLILNPNWFWLTFENVFNKLFDQLYANPEGTNPLRNSCLKYIQKLIT